MQSQDISPIELKYFTSRRRRFSPAMDFLGGFLFDEDGSFLSAQNVQ